MNKTIEILKLILLGAILAGCAVSFFTSTSFELTEQGIQQLHAPTRFRCSPAHDVFNENYNCKIYKTSDKNSEEYKICSHLDAQITLCEGAVYNAYREGNVRSCVKELHMQTLCTQKALDCPPNMNKEEKNDCQKRCMKSAQALEECFDRITRKHMRWVGLNRDGLYK